MYVVVYLEKRRVRCGDDRFEESIGSEDWRFAPEAVVEDNVEDSVL